MDPRILENAREAILKTNWRIHLKIPSVLEPGETFNLQMTAFGPDDLPGPLDREISFGDSPGIIGLPESVNFKDTDGTITIEGLRAGDPGDAWAAAIPGDTPSAVYSNPAWIMENPPWRIYWGDIHVHTTYSNCSPWACKDPEFCYAYARDASYIDFAAAADHLRGIASDESRWPRLQQLARDYTENGRFIAILGLESSHKTGWGGDNNAYYLNDDAPYFWLDRDDMRGIAPEVTLRQLWDFLDASGSPYFTAPHHTSRAGKFRDFSDGVYDPEREPVFEIYSMWGSSEKRWNRFPLHAGNTDKPSYFRDTLMRGCRYGLIASSDDHTTMVAAQTRARTPFGVKRLSNYHHRGLTAVKVPELTRDNIFTALKQRQCYATTFQRSLVDFKVNDIEMGSAYPVSKNDSLLQKRTISLRFLDPSSQRATATLIRNSAEIQSLPLDGKSAEISFTDETPLADCAIRDAQHHPEPFAVYYIRIQDMTDQTQWTSPIWLDL